MSGIAKAVMMDYVHEYVTPDQRVDIESALVRARSIFGNDMVDEMLRVSSGYGTMDAHVGAVYEEIARSLTISDHQFLRSLAISQKYGSILSVLVSVLNAYAHHNGTEELSIDLDE